jgi:hypothetical protein
MKIFNNYFSEFILPEWFNAPESLKKILRRAWNRKYSDLYDQEGNSKVYDAFKEVLETIGVPEDTTGHKRYVYIGWSIATAAYFRLAALFPEDERPKIALETACSWLRKDVEVRSNFADTLFPDYRQEKLYTRDDAYEIIYRFVETLDKNKAYQSLLWLLDDAFTGEALTVNCNELREFFNWWIIDVTPSAYYLKFPSCFCITGGIITADRDSDIPLIL